MNSEFLRVFPAADQNKEKGRRPKTPPFPNSGWLRANRNQLRIRNQEPPPDALAR